MAVHDKVQSAPQMARTSECECAFKGNRQWDLIIGDHPSIKEIVDKIDLVVKTGASVFITGESGTGKEVIARYIHQKSDRADKPWVAINCAALPRDVIDNELFGHEREAFTGALSNRPGCFEMAHGGTLFLDEIGEMHPQVQAKLLRAIELRSFRRIGGKEEIEVDLRIIAATNRDIKESLKSGQLREDLYYRLGVVEITLPPLRDRRSDVPLLVRYFACQLCEKYRKVCKQFTPEALDQLSSYPWPGNVREVRNAVESIVLTCAHDVVDIEHLPRQLRQEQPGTSSDQFIEVPLGTKLAEMERLVIKRTLESLDHNKSEAARILGISRKYLYSKLNEYELEGKVERKQEGCS
ncbi:MAG TPA: sigma-54 dependent transcriptional regulator [Bacteroidota bacterium]|nr:sigma-54 dependent transcriptional regulator [Bacteroidota bacterium]